jgi:hypothetical protein
VADIVTVQVDQGTEQLLHDHRSLSFTQVLPLKDKVKKFTAFAVPIFG